MPRDRDEPPAVRVYTVCDESKYLIVRNVPALGCEAELLKLFGAYGEIEELKPMDAENCEAFTDIYWIKFIQVNNARFAKRKLDEFVFLGNRLQVSYAPQYESLSDTKEKLEGRRKEVLVRLKSGRLEGLQSPISGHPQTNSKQLEHVGSGQSSHVEGAPITHVSSYKEYFPSPSMNQTVRVVREKLDKIQSSGEQPGPALKKTRVDNRRRI